MLAATIFTVIITTFGQITCAEVPYLLEMSETKEFDDPGIFVGLHLPVYKWKRSRRQHVLGDVTMMVPCVWIFKVVTLKSSITLGLAETENAFNIKEANIEEVWRKLPETQGQFHDCNPKSNATPVGKCMHICKEICSKWKVWIFLRDLPGL
uniref:Putative secreted protein n=1 Tax=Ixodes ricinus TaxID=34613 RepID=A0A090XE83_IXORI